MTPENWIKILYLYGPMALFAFMVFVLLGKAKAASGLSPQQQQIQNIAYLAVWASIFILGGIIVIFWWRINLPREFQISGMIHDLNESETITSTDDLFLRRIYKTPVTIDYEWRILTTSAITEPVQFLLQERNDPSQYFRYKIPATSELYKGRAEISYDRSTKRMKLADGKFIATLEPEPLSASNLSPQRQQYPLPPNFGTIVQADDSPTPDQLVKALESNDPIVRQKVQQALVTLGSKSINVLNAAVHNPASTLRVRTEALSTLEKIVGSKTIAKPDWQPVDLSYNPTLGIFVLGRRGEVSQIDFDGTGSHSSEIFKVPGSHQPVAISTDETAVYVAAQSKLGCALFRYLLATKKLTPKVLITLKSCSAIAADGKGLYVASAQEPTIWHWENWNASAHDEHRLNGLTGIGTLQFDRDQNRLLVADSTAGKLYAASLPSFQQSQLASNLGWINSIAVDKLHLLLASGKKVLSVDPNTGAGQNPPAPLSALNGGHLSGIVLDLGGGIWLSDYEQNSLTGPISLK